MMKDHFESRHFDYVPPDSAMISLLTGKSNCKLLKRIEASQISAKWKQDFGISWTPPLGVQFVDYYVDEDTGFCFYAPNVVAGGPELYSQLQTLPWYYMHDKWEFGEALRQLKPLSYDSRILEIGVGQGAFLAQARDAGLHVCGVELNPDGAEAARKQGFTILEKDMATVHAEDPKPWDAICAFQVLEHLSDPRLFLDQAVSLLKPGGLLILSVPNAQVSRKLDPDRNDLFDQPPHHMTHWDEGVFRSLETFLPLKLRQVGFEPLAPYHIGWFVGSWSQRMRKQAGQLIGKMILNRVTMPVVEKALDLGLRRLVHGHTLLVCFEKTESGPF